MGLFAWVVAVLFFVLGGVVLALPWKGVVAWVEGHPSGATPHAGRYAALLILPVLLLIGFVFILLGPWDADVCRALHEACLSQITAWQLPEGIAMMLGMIGIMAGGRFGMPFLMRLRRTVSLMPMPANLEGHWSAARAETERHCGMRLPPLRLVHGPDLVCYVKGWLRPRLYLSPSLLTELDHEELVGALCHEMAHLKRGDLLLGPVLFLSYCLLFFLPTSRYCYQRYLQERERAADDWAIARTGKPLALASALAKVAEKGASRGIALMGRLDLILERREIAPATSGRRGVWAVMAVTILASLPLLVRAHHPLEAWGRDVLLLFGILG